jgi:hypothetical protein
LFSRIRKTNICGLNNENNRVWCPWPVPTMSHGAKVSMDLLLAQLLTTSRELVSPNGIIYESETPFSHKLPHSYANEM